MALTAAIVSALLAIVVGILWTGRHRRRTGGVLALALTGVALGLVALDVGPRQLVDRQVDVCGLEDLDVRLASAPVAWQLATGGLRGEVRVPADTVTAMVADRLTQGPLVAPQVTLTDDAVRVDALVEAPRGPVPVGVDVDVSVDHGELTIAPGEVSVAGRVVPDGMLGSLSIDSGLRGNDTPRRCADQQAGPRHRLTGVDVDPEGLVLTVAV